MSESLQGCRGAVSTTRVPRSGRLSMCSVPPTSQIRSCMARIPPLPVPAVDTSGGMPTPSSDTTTEIGRRQVSTPITNAHLVTRLTREENKKNHLLDSTNTHTHDGDA